MLFTDPYYFGQTEGDGYEFQPPPPTPGDDGGGFRTGPPVGGGGSNVTATGGDEGGGGGGGGGGMGGGFYIPRYDGPMSASFKFPKLPNFRAPQFAAPSYEEAMNSPGYQFRVNQGLQALQQSRAAQGLLRSGDTAKSLIEFGQNTASQEYQNVFNRALDAYDRKYKASVDEFAPQMARYNNSFQAEQARALQEQQMYWNQYAFREDAYLRALLGAQAGSTIAAPAGDPKPIRREVGYGY